MLFVCWLCCWQVLKQAGGAAQPTVFLFSDSQLKDESFLEDINNILNTGEVRGACRDVFHPGSELCMRTSTVHLVWAACAG
jgi:hypothetical protein